MSRTVERSKVSYGTFGLIPRQTEGTVAPKDSAGATALNYESVRSWSGDTAHGRGWVRPESQAQAGRSTMMARS